ncbi:DUF1127 domain-containing protein [Aestuariivita boseongensis]|uniref:DUF1127 domain-containing protein n=1 Tax=Aestuariivita boseongensis TaxID=1470562 RepID=UPI000681CC79|nr:DUF1127 domain-containing protein [Aestuariivita boseongensis]
MTYINTHTARFHAPARKRIGLVSLLDLWRTRRQLKSLDDRALADIGLTRREADAEAARPVWDVPATWRD